ncbi:MAG: AAA family ATPase, partial [Acidimicrobiales bacterium]
MRESVGSEYEPVGATALFERREAIEAIDSVLDRLSEGEGRSLFLVGEAGLGKTTLLRRIEAKAAPIQRRLLGPYVVGRTSAGPYDTGQAFAIADQLFASLAINTSTRGRALNGQDERSNRFLSSIRALDECSAESPVVLVLDDLHWADPDSLALVEFISRHIASRRVALVATLRPWPTDALEVAGSLNQDGLSEVCELLPLSDEASRALLMAKVWGGVSSGVATEAASACAGNPLLLEEVARSLLGGHPIPAFEPFSSRRRDILLRRFASVSEATFRLLRSASIFGTTFRPSAARDVAGMDSDIAAIALDEAIAARIVEPGTSEASFVHPAFSGALYEGIHDPLRSELHRSAFRVLRSMGAPAAEAAEHAILAGTTDPDAVACMLQAGTEANKAGAWSSALHLLSNAIEIAGGDPPPALVRELAEALIETGSAAEAVKRLEELLLRRDFDGIERGRALIALGAARLIAGRPGSPVACFEEAARILEPLDSTLAVHALLKGAFAARTFQGAESVIRMAESARWIAPPDNLTTKLQIDAAWGSGSLMLGVYEGYKVLARAVGTIESDPGLLDEFSESGWWPLVWYAGAAAATEHFEEAQHAFDIGFQAAEGRSWTGAMGAHLMMHGDLMYRTGRLSAVAEDIAKLESLIEIMPVMTPFVTMMQCLLSIEQDRPAEAESKCAFLESILEHLQVKPPAIALWTVRARATLDLMSGDALSACAALDRGASIAEARGLHEPCIIPWWEPAIGCYRLAGRFDDLQRVIDWLDRAVVDLPCIWPRVYAQAGRALVAENAGDLEASYFHFDQAFELMQKVPLPINHARLLIW